MYQSSLERLVRRRYGDLDQAAIARARADELNALLRPVSTLTEADLVRRAEEIVEEERKIREER